ncbi:MAG: hypothetical protein J5657_02575 [Clostridiales bacterium]|nr:hypothetical protein [Clostridiales bacterium]
MRFSIRGLFFILACIISAIAVVIPFYEFSVDGSITQSATISLLYNGDKWYWSGIVILVADVAAILMTLAGFKKPLAIIAVANCVTSIYAVIYTNMTKESIMAIVRIMMKFSESLSGSKASSQLIVSNGPGYYLIILALFMVIVTGLWAAFERD